MSTQPKFTGESLAAFWVKKYLLLFKVYCLSSEDHGLIAFSLLLPCLYFAHSNASQVLGAVPGRCPLLLEFLKLKNVIQVCMSSVAAFSSVRLNEFFIPALEKPNTCKSWNFSISCLLLKGRSVLKFFCWVHKDFCGFPHTK